LDDRRQAAFYEVFMDNIRKYGRIQEMDMMFHYFWVMKDPRVPLEFTPLGTKLLWQGKVHPGHPKIKGQGILERLFMKARQVEGTLCDTPTIQDAP
jgi:heterodisulfide reductase subunit C